MPFTDGQSLLDALLISWDRHQTALLNLLSAIPANGLQARAMDSSPSVAEMFTHMHHERMISLQENAPEYAGEVPANEWIAETETRRIREMLQESSRRVRDAVEARIESGKPLDQDFPHPLQFLQFLVFHESYHHGQIKLALKASGLPLPDAAIGPLVYDVWRAR